MPLLFSYGTLQQEVVQISTFGRVLAGEPDELIGFEQTVLRLDDPRFAGDDTQYSIVKFTGRSGSRVKGMVLEISETELSSADDYEPPPYKRIMTTLASGREAWVYADTR